MEGSTSATDHDLLIELNANVKNLSSSLNSYTDSNNRITQDHEARLRVLEAENQKLQGAQHQQKVHMNVVSWVGGLIGVALTVWSFLTT